MSITPPRNRLKALREAAGMSRHELAAGVSSSYGGRKGEPVSQSTISRWERGETPIPERHWARLAEIFNVPASHLLGLDDNGGNGNADGHSEAA